MRNLLLISLFLFLAGCRTIGHRELQTSGSRNADVSQLPSCYKGNFVKVLYKSEITLFRNHLGGLTLIKRMPDSSYRVNFITEMGLKIFDLEIKKEKFSMVYCIEQLNKKKTIQLLKNDFQLLLTENVFDGKAKVFTQKNNAGLVYRFRQHCRYYYYFVDEQEKKLYRIEEGSSFSIKKTILYSAFTDGFPAAAEIRHHDIKFLIKLNKIY